MSRGVSVVEIAHLSTSLTVAATLRLLAVIRAVVAVAEAEVLKYNLAWCVGGILRRGARRFDCAV